MKVALLIRGDIRMKSPYPGGFNVTKSILTKRSVSLPALSPGPVWFRAHPFSCKGFASVNAWEIRPRSPMMEKYQVNENWHDLFEKKVPQWGEALLYPSCYRCCTEWHLDLSFKSYGVCVFWAAASFQHAQWANSRLCTQPAHIFFQSGKPKIELATWV